MTPAQVGFCLLLLLLLLGLWLSPSTVSAKPKDMTSAKWFETQHVQPHPQPCSSAMPRVNYYKRHCKNLNTFLHQSLSSVITTCDTRNRTCKNGHGNCHESPGPVSMTMCQLVSGLYPNCKYEEKDLTKSYVVACDPPQQGDPQQYKLVPVHLDQVLQASRSHALSFHFLTLPLHCYPYTQSILFVCFLLISGEYSWF